MRRHEAVYSEGRIGSQSGGSAASRGKCTTSTRSSGMPDVNAPRNTRNSASWRGRATYDSDIITVVMGATRSHIGRRIVPVLWSLVLSTMALAFAPEALTVMSFNVRYGTADDGPNRWELRRGPLIRPSEKSEP